MKILIITDKMDIGGAETHIFTLITELAKSGNAITLLSSGGAFAKALEKTGIKCISAPLDRRDALSIRKSQKIIAEQMKHHDIIHAHTRLSAHLAKRARGSCSYPPILTTAHLDFPKFPFGPMTYWGDMTLAVSDDIKEHLQKSYRVPSENIKLTKNAIDTNLFTSADTREKIIIHTSRIDKDRSLAAFLLVSVAKELLSSNKDWKIIIVGGGKKLGKLKEYAKKVNEQLGFCGIIITGPRTDIPNLISRASIFVGVSRSALEGMASGIPTVICGNEGYGGIITKDNFGLLAKTNFCARKLPRPKQKILFSDLSYLMSNPSEREELGEFLKYKIKDSYKTEDMAKDADYCYKKLYRKPKVCLIGFFGFSNLGDEVTLECAINTLSKRGISDFSVLSEVPCTKSVPGVSIKEYPRMNPSAIATAIANSDAVILCGGNLLQNETSTRSLLYYSQVISYAKSLKKRIMLLSSGFGQIHGHFAEFLLSKSLKGCSFCGCRTRYDLNIAKKYTPFAYIMPDLCFTLEEGVIKCNCEKFAWIVGKNSKISSSEIKRISTARHLRAVLIMLFPDEDRGILKRESITDFEIRSPRNFDELRLILEDCAFVISERLHGAILPILCHRAVYITASNCKNSALLDEIKKRSDGHCDVIYKYSVSDILEKKEIGACDSDFNYVISSMNNDIQTALDRLF